MNFILKKENDFPIKIILITSRKKKMTINKLQEEIKKISLTNFQRENVNNHFNEIKNELNSMNYNNIQKQGSFGRGTVVQDQGNEGFDLDIAIVLENMNPEQSYLINFDIFNRMKRKYNGITQSVKIDKKAIQIDVKSNFGIDITQICKKGKDEYVWNHDSFKFEPSGALKFKDSFRKVNSESNNCLRDLAKIYKHINKSIDNLPDFRSIALEILLFNSYESSNNNLKPIHQKMIDTLKIMGLKLN